MIEKESIKDLVSRLENSNKVERKRGLENVMKVVKEDASVVEEDCDDELLRSLLKCLSDKYERCREISSEILSHLTLTCAERIKPHLYFIIQTLTRRLSVEEEYEASEEVRIRLMQLLSALFTSFGADLHVHVEDVIEIVANTLGDNCPDIKKQAAETIIKISETNSKVLRMKGESLVAPLARNISHRQASVR